MDALQYFWTGSPDKHVRVMEIEAYGGEEDLDIMGL